MENNTTNPELPINGTEAPVKKESKKDQSTAVTKKTVSAPAIPDVLIKAGITQHFNAPKKAFIAAGGTEQEFAREINFAMQMLMKNSYLVQCVKNDPDFFIEAIKNVALTGLSLNPELKLGYLVPRAGKVYFSSSYMGKREILIRAGIVTWIEANLVYESDFFEVSKGSESTIIHKPDYFNNNREKENIKGGYWIASLPNGKTVFDVMSISWIENIRSRSEAVKKGNGSPWDTDFVAMARKSMINAGFNQLPKTGISENIIKAIEAETRYDNDVFEDWKEDHEKRQRMEPDSFESDSEYVKYEEV